MIRRTPSRKETALAEVALDDSVSEYLRCMDYGFSIPAGAVIDGIVVDVRRRTDNQSGTTRDADLRLVKDGANHGDDRSTATNYPNNYSTESHGGANDLWGASWTAANINATNFGAALRVEATGNEKTVRVDHISITVHYSLAPATPFECKPPPNIDPALAAQLTCRCDTFARTSLNPSTIFERFLGALQ